MDGIKYVSNTLTSRTLQHYIFIGNQGFIATYAKQSFVSRPYVFSTNVLNSESEINTRDYFPKILGELLSWARRK